MRIGMPEILAAGSVALLVTGHSTYGWVFLGLAIFGAGWSHQGLGESATESGTQPLGPKELGKWSCTNGEWCLGYDASEGSHKSCDVQGQSTIVKLKVLCNLSAQSLAHGPELGGKRV